MEFQIGQCFIRLESLTNMKGLTLKIITPVGEKHMLMIGATIESGKYPIAASVEMYEKGDNSAEESAIS